LVDAPNPAVLTGVAVVHVDACDDQITFTFDGGTPAWSVGYQPGPFTQDASGAPVTVAGSAYLVIRFDHASSVDPTDPQARRRYTGSRDIQPVAASAVRELVQIGDFEGVMRWVGGVEGQYGFRVSTSPGKIVIDVLHTPS
jgi:hypothetical protein